MSDQSHLEELLKIYKGNVEHLEKQIAILGGHDLAPVPIKNQYDSNLAAFKAVEAQLTFSFTGRSRRFLGEVLAGAYQLQKEDSSLDINRLANDERLLTVLAHAGQIAIRNHQKEKLEALRNAVLNSWTSTNSEEEIELYFLNVIDQLTPLQIQILKFINAPYWEGRDELWSEHYRELIQPYDFENYNQAQNQVANAFTLSALVDKREQLKNTLDKLKNALDKIDMLYPKDAHMLLFDMATNAFPALRDNMSLYVATTNSFYIQGFSHSVETAKQPPPFFMVSFTTDLGKQLLAYIASPLKSTEQA